MGLSKLDTDAKLENEGVPVVVHTDTNAEGEEYDVRIVVKRAGGENKRYLKAKNDAFKVHQRQLRLGQFSDERFTKILQGVYSRHVVTSWENVDLDGEMVECTPENVLAVFIRYPVVWEAVLEVSQSAEIYREDVEESVKNS